MSRNEADLASLSCLDDQVRGRLYTFVAGRTEPVGRDEAAAAVGIGRALAVYHLDKLVRAGLLRASYRRPPGRNGPGAGRPAKVYSRSGGEFMVTVPVREYELAAHLLVEVIGADRSGQAMAALRAAAHKLGTHLAEGGAVVVGPGQFSTVRVDPVQAALSERGYEPWHDDAGTLRMRNCPFRHLAELEPEVICQMNLALIQGLVAGLGVAGLNPILDPEPELCCVAIPAARHDMNGTP